MLPSDGAIRPLPRHELPFRLKKNIANRRFLEYDEVTQTQVGPKKQPFLLEEGFRPFAPIVELITMYRELEAQVDGLIKERDEARDELAKIKGNGVTAHKGAKVQRQGQKE